MDSRFVSDEVAYDGAICRVRKVGLGMDDGQIVPRELIEMADATVIVPVLPDESVVMIRNERFAVNEDLLEFPAGKLDSPDEPPAECAARELAEETGYSAGRIEPLGSFYSCPGLLTERLHAFGATDLTAGEQALEGYERIRVQVVPPGRVRELIRSGELHDAKSIAAWALWRLAEAG